MRFSAGVQDSKCMDGGLKVFEDDPQSLIIHDSVYIPRIPGHYDAQFGIYDIYGRLVQTAGPRRGWPTQALGQASSCCVSPSKAFPAAPELQYFYGGNIVPHYGHFITETLPRYWCGRAAYEGMKILVHAEKTLDSLFAIPWLAEFFSLLGLARDDFVVFDRPTRLRSLIVAGTSFEENHFAHRAFARFCNALGDRYGEDVSDDRPVYLSRAGFNSQMRTIRGEHDVVSHLERAGFAIISPETLSLRQQLRLFSSHRPTTGFVGSAFHNDIFCASPVGIALTCDGLVSSNFALMDRVNDARIRYVTTPGIILEKFVLGQPALYRLEDPRRVASHLIDLVTARAWEMQKEDHPDRITYGEAFTLLTAHQTWLQIDRQTGIVVHGSGQGERIVKVTVRLGEQGWAALTTSVGDCLSVERDNAQGVIVYLRYTQRADGRIALFSDETSRFLCAQPDGKLPCDRAEPKEWEFFGLVRNAVTHSTADL